MEGSGYVTGRQVVLLEVLEQFEFARTGVGQQRHVTFIVSVIVARVAGVV